MADKLMYFGTREYMQWIACPAVDMPSSKHGWSSKLDYLSGGASVRRSTAAHKEYVLTWPGTSSRDDIRPILDYADGLYGDGPFYWLDPIAMDRNVLPQWFASPFQGVDDGPILTGYDVRGTAINTAPNGLGYPTRSIQYNLNAGTANVLPIWVPIPDGYTAWVGVHGASGTGGEIRVTPYVNGAASPVVPAPFLGVTDTQRVNLDFDGSDFTSISIALAGTGTVTLSGIICQVLPTGQTPRTGGFISGQGHSGCEFEDQPEYSPYSAALDMVGASASMVEVGGWR
jgi:hypothetical protein